nr:putative ribonuclease H-like domain-containing protein [Tanacetum cinerariifolium]
MIRNKARLVAQGHTQEEGIDYDEFFALVSRIKAISLFLAYASFKDFVVYQMDLKSAFLYGKIKEEMYVCQPPGFEDPNFPDRVYKVEKVLYVLHQAPRAWYETLSTYLLDNGFQRGKIDKTLFIKRHKDEAVYKELDDSLVRAATTTSSLEAEHDSGGGPNAKKPWRILLFILGLRECLNLQSMVLKLEKTKTTQTLEIDSLKKRVKKLEKKQRSRTHKLKILYKVGLIARIDSSRDEQNLGEDASKKGRKIHDIDADEDITLVNYQDDVEMFDVNDLHGEEVFVEEVAAKEVSASSEVNAASIATTVSVAATITTEKITLAQALKALKTLKPKIRGIVMKDQEEPSESTTKTISSKQSQDKGKGIMVEEPIKIKKKYQIRLDEEAALRLQVRKEESYLQEKEQKKRGTNYQYKLTKKIMCTYLKNMEGKKLKDLKNKSFDSIQKMFDIVFNRVNIFVDFKTELVEGSSKRAGKKLIQESAKKQKVDDDKAKKQKVDDDKETAELKRLMKIIPDEEELAIDAITLAVKSLGIVDWKIYKEGNKSY